jgi:hypothetical protein
VLGYHGAKVGEAADYAKALLLGEVGVEQWKPSENEYDWLGHGIYFWEHSPERASRWAGTDGIVIGAVIQLGACLDLTDLRYTELLIDSYHALETSYRKKNLELPQNSGRELKLRERDCLVINHLAATMSEQIQTVRGAFEEGSEAFPGAALKMETHIQIAVRDRRCILGIFRPTAVDEKESGS